MTFENIFSKTETSSDLPKCPNPKIPIIIDSREKQSLIYANLVGKSANVSFEKLEIGDYLIDGTVIERKTYADLVASIIDKRLPEQLANLKKYPKNFLLIEGFDYDYKKFKVHENAVRGIILSVILDFQTSIIYTKNEEDTANFLLLIAKKAEKPKTEFSLRQTKTAKTIEEQKQFILEGFPGVGPVAAKKLIEKFGSIKNIINAQEKEIEEQLGKKTHNFKEILEK